MNMPVFSSAPCPRLHFHGTPRALINKGDLCFPRARGLRQLRAAVSATRVGAALTDPA